jgi:effector-binding domain-containing protein
VGKHSVETLVEKPVLGIRTRLKATEIGERIGELIPEVMKAAGADAAGPMIARWHDWTGDGGEMELAVPVRAPVQGRGRARPSSLPGGKALVLTHVGSYEKLRDSWGEMHRLIKEEGHVGRAAPWEEYVDDCHKVPVEKLRTRIVWPIE